MNSTKLEPPLVAIQALLLTLDRVTPHQANCRMRETGAGKCTCIVGQIKDAADTVAAPMLAKLFPSSRVARIRSGASSQPNNERPGFDRSPSLLSQPFVGLATAPPWHAAPFGRPHRHPDFNAQGVVW